MQISNGRRPAAGATTFEPNVLSSKDTLIKKLNNSLNVISSHC